MSNSSAPKTVKWPFLLGDLLLVGAAGVIAYQARPLGPWQTVALVAAVALGAWILIQPFIKDQETESHFEELKRLGDTVAQINKIEDAADRIGRASMNWQGVQDQAGKTLDAARGISEGFSKEAQAFQQFLQRAGDSEKSALRLEIEKLRRSEGEWLQISVRMLDHVFALFAGARRSGQPALIEQIGNFQNACLDSARRIGLNPFAAQPEEVFNEKLHRTPDGTAPEAGAVIADTLVPGFTFQGQLLRPAIVALRVDQPEEEAPTVEAGEELTESEVAEDVSNVAEESTGTEEETPQDSASEKPKDAGAQSFLL